MTAVADTSPPGRPESADYQPLFKVNDTNLSRIPKWMIGYTPPPYELVDYGLCSEETSWLFDPRTQDEIEEVGYAAARYRTEAAQRICRGTEYTAGCPVAAECLAYGIDNDLIGVFGGELLTEARIKRAKAEAQIKEDPDAGGCVDAGAGNTGQAAVDAGRSRDHRRRGARVEADQPAQAVVPAERRRPRAS